MLTRSIQEFCDSRIEPKLPLMNEEPAVVRQYIGRILRADVKNYTTAKEFARTRSFFWLSEPDTPLVYKNDSLLDAVRDKLLETLTALAPHEWHYDPLSQAVQTVRDSFLELEPSFEMTPEHFAKYVNAQVWKALRFLVAWGVNGPNLVVTMEILGPSIVLDRIRNVKVAKVEETTQPEVEMPVGGREMPSRG